MKSFSSFRNRTKIAATEKYDVLRDGGSHIHEVLNPEECGFVQVIQNFSIHSAKNGTRGKWYGMLPPPNHTGDKHVELDSDDITFV
jgi:hypothetical protein